MTRANAICTGSHERFGIRENRGKVTDGAEYMENKTNRKEKHRWLI
ncbi:hypothetical protein HMPREF0658_1396 [Hoylesella marshii DSM 16973 = JCM 13450]|uniref:Uncharacterized protein n=1 Tax=Hoylesella marshii DSM 16973 = JCM 13450 TaxID=862515 RepID=E0NT94_9BACT|nr:hypothetical protein HMPREF0658_1396 [Hoylesella marshii DSM 16973 = JCM 13450]